MSLLVGQLEEAANELCRLRGVDPDDFVQRKRGVESNFDIAKNDIRKFKQLLDAMKVAEEW